MNKGCIKTFDTVRIHTAPKIKGKIIPAPWHRVMEPHWDTEHGPWCAERRQRIQNICSTAQQPGISTTGKERRRKIIGIWTVCTTSS